MTRKGLTAEEALRREVSPVSCRLRRILLGADGSAPSVEATKVAIALARLAGAEVIAVFVDVGYPEQKRPEAEEGYHPTPAGLAYAQELGRINGVPVKTVQRIGHITANILAVEEEEEVDLIVVGDTGRTGLQRMALGSIAESVVRHASVPVLVVRKGTSSKWELE